MNKRELNKKDIKISLILAFIACIGGLLACIYSLKLLTPEQMGGLTKSQLMIVMTLQVTVFYGFLLSFIGLKLARATHLDQGLIVHLYTDPKKYKFHPKSLLLVMSLGCGLAAFNVLCDKFIYIPAIPALGVDQFVLDPIYLLMGIIYGGVVEEIMLRLFLMSLTTFILYKLFGKKYDKTNIPAWIYILSIFLTSIVFAVGHLPAASMQFELTPLFVFRLLLGNTLPGIVFGTLYWKKGFEYGVLAHMLVHIFTQLVFLPLFF